MSAPLVNVPRDSFGRHGGIDDAPTFDRLRSLRSPLSYVSGDGKEPATFEALEVALGGAQRGGRYESASCLRDVIKDHLFQIVALLAMKWPAYQGFAAVQSEKASVFRGRRPATAVAVVRSQYDGYRKEQAVAAASDIETFYGLRLHVDSWRLAGVLCNPRRVERRGSRCADRGRMAAGTRPDAAGRAGRAGAMRLTESPR